MSRKRDALSDLRTAFNCPAKWSDMRGDVRIRNCSKCSQKVYNISEMTREEAVALLEENGAHICARFYQKADGTILTRPCRGFIRRKTYGLKMAGLTALTVIGLPVFLPTVSTGKVVSPRANYKMNLFRVRMLDEDIAAAKDRTERDALVAKRTHTIKILHEVYSDLSQEDIQKLGPPPAF